MEEGKNEDKFSKFDTFEKVFHNDKNRFNHKDISELFKYLETYDCICIFQRIIWNRKFD